MTGLSARACVLVVLTVLAAVGVSAGRSSPSVSFKPGLFKMLAVGGGGHVPAAGPVIKVEYDKTHRRYSHIGQKPLELRATVTADCGSMDFQEMTITTLSKTFPVTASGLAKSGDGAFIGTKTFTTNQLTTAALASVVPDPVATCNADLHAFVKNDQHGKVQKGWARQYDNVLLAELTASCQGKSTKKGGFSEPGPIARPSEAVRFPVWVHCSPAPVFKVMGPSPKDVPVKKSGFQAVKVYVNPPANANYRGPCPKELTFGGEIEYLLPSGASADVQYRYRTHDGGASPVFSTTLTSGKKILSSWKREYGGGNPTGGFAAPAGSGGTRVIDGTVRLEVLGANGTVVGQNQAGFKVTCEPTRVSGPAAGRGGGAVQAQPVSPAGGAIQAGMVLADLVIRSAQPAAGSATALRIEVANVGNAASQPTTLAVFYERSGQVVKKSFAVPALAPRQSRSILADVSSPLAHADRLTARVNDSGGSKESDLSNNTRTIK